jgi:hypothetical protein
LVDVSIKYLYIFLIYVSFLPHLIVYVQCAWRCRQGRLGTQLLRSARKMRHDEETKAAFMIQNMFICRKARHMTAWLAAGEIHYTTLH